MDGKMLGNRYEIITKLGSGGMANVYQARDTVLNRVVTVKVLKQELAEDKDFMRRFQVEAQAVASLSHPNIVSIYDVGEENGLPYLVMEYVEGSNLKEVISRRGALSPAETVNIGIQVCAALAHAHSKGIIHRDIKPHNIMMTTGGRVKVMDFGLARVLSAPNATMTQSGTVMGSVHYFSPEQARGEETTPMTDIYALGVVLYETVSGHVPFQGDNPVSIALKHLQEDPPSLCRENPEIPRGLESIIFKAMAKKPEQRFASAREMQNALAGGPLSSNSDDDDDHTRVLNLPSEPLMEERPGEQRRGMRPAAIAAIVLGVLILLAGLGWAALTWLTPAEATVPDVTKLSQSDAQLKLKNAGFKVETFNTFSKDVAAGYVVRQKPEGNTVSKKGRVVQIWVSQGQKMVWLPSVREYPLRDAKNLLTNLGFKVNDQVQSINDPQIPPGYVVSQSPEGNQNVSEGTEITLIVSKGPQVENRVMPSLIGLTADQAKAALASLGLKLGTVTDEPNNQYPSGVIFRQEVVPGTPVKQGDTINVTRSSGAPQPLQPPSTT